MSRKQGHSHYAHVYLQQSIFYRRIKMCPYDYIQSLYAHIMQYISHTIWLEVHTACWCWPLLNALHVLGLSTLLTVCVKAAHWDFMLTHIYMLMYWKYVTFQYVSVKPWQINHTCRRLLAVAGVETPCLRGQSWIKLRKKNAFRSCFNDNCFPSADWAGILKVLGTKGANMFHFSGYP